MNPREIIPADGGGFFVGSGFFSVITADPETMRQAARRAVVKGRKGGSLPADPGGCIGSGPHIGRVVAHHFDYAQPTATIALCHSCHKRVHSGSIAEPLTGRAYPRGVRRRAPQRRDITGDASIPAVGRLLRQLRKSRGLGPTEMARLLTEHGRAVSKQHLLYIELEAKSHPQVLLDAYRAALSLPDWIAAPIYQAAGAYFTGRDGAAPPAQAGEAGRRVASPAI